MACAHSAEVVLVPAVRRLLNADEVVRQEIASLKGAQVGVIKIGTYLSCSIHWIPGIIQKFHHTHPTSISKLLDLRANSQTGFRERRVDIGFISRQEGHRYQFLPVMDDELFAVLPEGHPFLPNIRQSHWKNLTVFLCCHGICSRKRCAQDPVSISDQARISVSSPSLNFLCFPWSNTDLASPFCPVSFSADRPAVLCSAALRQVSAASSDLPIPPTVELSSFAELSEYSKISC